MPDNNYTIRPLGPEDVAAYKAIRLEALQTEPGVFCSSYAREAAFDDETWVKRLTNPNAAHFGLYADAELIGITGIIKDTQKEGDAHMVQSYIRKEHRGKQLSRMFYEARLNWAKANNVQRVIVGHRLSNTTSKAANQRYGFVYTDQEMQDWPDGSREEVLNYVLELY